MGSVGLKTKPVKLGVESGGGWGEEEEGRKGTGREGWKGGFDQNTLHGLGMAAFHPALRKPKKVGFCKFEANLVSIVSFRPAGAVK